MSVNQPFLEQLVQRLANTPAWNIHSVDEATDTDKPWYKVTGQIAKDLIINEAQLEEQVASIAAQIQHWGRLEAQARRVWAMTDRKYRRWRDQKILELLEPPSNADKAKEWKKPTEKALEAGYRSDAQYEVWQQRIERSEEAFNATHAVLEGWRAKKEMLQLAVYRRREDSAPRLQV